MEIRSAADITAEAVRYLRQRAGLTQRAFWSRVGVTQPGGWHYEHGATPILKPVRLLVFIVYVAGIDPDCQTEEGAAAMLRLGKLYAASRKPEHC